MKRGQQQRQRLRAAVACAVAFASLLLGLPPCAFALDPRLDINQYAHTAWKIRDGFAKGAISSVVQTPDGYLWLGTASGLLRFDGVRNIPWQPPANQHLPSTFILSLVAARDGTLWIGTANGLVSWKDNRLTEYPELSGHYIFNLLETRGGVVWVGGMRIGVAIGRLCAIHKGSIHCDGDDGGLHRGVVGLYEDSKGNLWVGVFDGLWRWRPGPPKFYPLPGEPNGIQALSEDADGTLLVGWKRGIYRFVDGKTEAYSQQGKVQQFKAHRLLRDRDGGLWIGTSDRGLLHVHQGRADVFAESDGLSGDEVPALLEDREGTIWVANVNGLDRFRNFAVPTFSDKQGLLSAVVSSVLADRDGSVWLSTRGGLNRWNHEQIKIRRLGNGKLNDHPQSLFQDNRGRIWVSTLSGTGYLENDRFIPVSGIPGGEMLAITQGRVGNVFIADESSGLYRVSPQNEVEHIPWSRFGHQDYASVLAPNRTLGVWMGFVLGGIAYWADGKVRASYTAADGLGAGRVSGFLFDHEGALWVATEGGLSRLKDGRIFTLTSKNALPCDAVHWALEDDDHAFWLYTACGLVRIDRSELDAWATDPARTIQATVFDIADGVRSLAIPGFYSPQVARTADGRIWFLPWDGVSVFDPHNLHLNKVPPPVYVEQVIADRKTYDASSHLRLPPLVRDLQIDYTALSLAAPEKVRFRYKLEGLDHDWQEAGTRRQAFYTNLPPRAYRFRVMACNNSGVWNEAGASLDFSVAPAYYQTIWFRFCCVAAFLGLALGVYRLRLRQVAHQYNIRLEERVNERTRIARELHDTLLQSFQGVLLKFHAVTYVRDLPAEAKKALTTAIDQARQAITEGRDAVEGLRSSIRLSNNLAAELSVLGDELAQQADGVSPAFRVLVQGAQKDLVPLVRDDVFRIAGEALRNAFLHAKATRIEVEIHYDRRQFLLRIRDDGKGIGPEVLAAGGRDGHYGLRGMHERAKLLGGELAVWSELDSGTETELALPAAVAYAHSQSKRRFLFWRNGA